MHDLSHWDEGEDGLDALMGSVAQGLALAAGNADDRRRKLVEALLADVGAAAVQAFDIAGDADLQQLEPSSRLRAAQALAIDFLSRQGEAAPLEEAVDDLSDGEVATLYLGVEEHLRSQTVSGFRGLLLWSRLAHRSWSNEAVNTPGMAASAHMDSVLDLCVHLLRQTSRVHEPVHAIAERVSDLAPDFVRRVARLACALPIRHRIMAVVCQVDLEARVAHPIVAGVRRRMLSGLAARLVDLDGPPARTNVEWAECVLQGLQTADLTTPRISPGSWALNGSTVFDDGIDGDEAWGRCRVAALVVLALAPVDAMRAQTVAEGILGSALRWTSHQGLQVEALKACMYVVDAGHVKWIASKVRKLARDVSRRFENNPEIRLHALRVLAVGAASTFHEQREFAASAYRLASHFPSNAAIQIEASKILRRLALATSSENIHHALNAAELVGKLAAANLNILCIRIEACRCWAYIAGVARDCSPGLVRRAFDAASTLADGLDDCYPIQVAKADSRVSLAWCLRQSDPQGTLSHAMALYEVCARFDSRSELQLAQARAWRFVAFAFRGDNVDQVEDAARRVARIAREYPGEILIQLQSAQAWRSLVWALADIDIEGTLRVAHHVEQIARFHMSDGFIQIICAETWRLVAYAAQQRGNFALAKRAAVRIDELTNECIGEENYNRIKEESELAWRLVMAAEDVASGRRSADSFCLGTLIRH